MNTEQINKIKSSVSLADLLSILKEIHNSNFTNQNEKNLIIDGINQCECVLNILKSPDDIEIGLSYFNAVDKLKDTLKSLIPKWEFSNLS